MHAVLFHEQLNFKRAHYFTRQRCQLVKTTKHESKYFTGSIKTINERSTACLVSDLYAKLFRGHRDEVCNQKESKISLKECSILWWTPIIKALESTDRLKRSYIYEVF